MNNYPLTLLYDAACPLCLAEMTRLMAHNRAGLLRFVDVSAADFDAASYGTTRTELLRVIHAVCADGSVVTGIDAIRLAYGGAGFKHIAKLLGLPGIRHIAAWAYPFIADNRYLLSGWFRKTRKCKDAHCNFGNNR